MKKDLLIIGGKSTALEIYDVIECFFKNTYNKILFVIGDHEKMDGPYNYITDSQVEEYVNNRKCNYILSFANHMLRIKFEKIFQQYSVSPVNVIHPSSIMSGTSSIGLGNYVAAGVIVSFNAVISNHNMINFSVTIGHDSFIKDHVIINPGARISGNVIIGNRVLIGSNSVILQGKEIGDDCFIDALTYIERDIEKNRICSSQHLKIFKRVV